MLTQAYSKWWHKPLDIETPLIIHDRQLEKLVAYMWMASKTSAIAKPKPKSSDIQIRVGRDSEFEAIEYRPFKGEDRLTELSMSASSKSPHVEYLISEDGHPQTTITVDNDD